MLQMSSDCSEVGPATCKAHSLPSCLMKREPPSLSQFSLQVWKGAFLLADLALSLGHRLSSCNCLELGCGTGLTGICLAMVAAKVCLTDFGESVLANCKARLGRLFTKLSSQKWREPCVE